MLSSLAVVAVMVVVRGTIEIYFSILPIRKSDITCHVTQSVCDVAGKHGRFRTDSAAPLLFMRRAEYSGI